MNEATEEYSFLIQTYASQAVKENENTDFGIDFQWENTEFCVKRRNGRNIRCLQTVHAGKYEIPTISVYP